MTYKIRSKGMNENDAVLGKFSNSTFPGGPGWRKSHSLPLGFIVSPLQGVSSIECVREQEMVVCRSCGAYLNMYCPRMTMVYGCAAFVKKKMSFQPILAPQKSRVV
jgi:Vesicle coat complex COPII, subunit SEC23